jgi:hypothetical protein
MAWSVDLIQKILYVHDTLLPTVDLVLKDGPARIKATGWLPCHHGNVKYTLELKKQTDGRFKILRVVHMKIQGKISRRVIQTTAKRVAQGRRRFAPTRYTSDMYTQQAAAAYCMPALWLCAVLYTHWELRNMDVPGVGACIQDNVEQLLTPTSIAFRRRFLKTPRVTLQKALGALGLPAITDWTPIEDRLAWATQVNTASRERLSAHIPHVENYQGLWTTRPCIDEARQLHTLFTSRNVTLLLGSPNPSMIPQDAVVVFRNLEDVYKWKCAVDWGLLCLLSADARPHERLVELGVADVQTLQGNQRIFVPWAHHWGYRDWNHLMAYTPTHMTLIGREDQWPVGRGQLFRDMLLSNLFDVSVCYHAATDCVVMRTVENVVAFVHEMAQQHPIIQCFSNDTWSDIDTGRRLLKDPFRIRTLRKVGQRELYEEQRIHHPDKEINNASVRRIRGYRGLRVPVGIYICDEKTTPFDIHVARTYCRDRLYVVNCTTSLFALRKTAPQRVTINPFHIHAVTQSGE